MDISHRSFDESCIIVTHFDPKNGEIKIKIDGFERYFFESLFSSEDTSIETMKPVKTYSLLNSTVNKEISSS